MSSFEFPITKRIFAESEIASHAFKVELRKLLDGYSALEELIDTGRGYRWTGKIQVAWDVAERVVGTQ